MPEYLAPGVYLEEVPSGNKPIEGVSTSTAGVVGVTQRGPVGMPRLVTSFSEFQRVYGGLLDHRVFTGGLDALPYAAQGFFGNGGQRLYVSRIVGPGATRAEVDLLGVPELNQASTVLFQRGADGDTSIFVEDETNIDAGDILLLQDGDRSEHVTVDSAPTATNEIRLVAGLRTALADTDAVTPQTVSEDVDLTGEIDGDMEAGGGLVLTAAGEGALSGGDVVRIRDTEEPERVEYVTITGGSVPEFDEDGLLFDHPRDTTEVHVVTLTADTAAAADGAVEEGATVITLDSSADVTVGGAVITPAGEIYGVAGVVAEVELTTGTELAENHPTGTPVIKQVELLRIHARYEGQWGNSLVAGVRRASLLETTVVDGPFPAGSPLITLDAVFGLTEGSVVEVIRGGAVVTRERVAGVNRAENQVEVEGGLAVQLETDDTVRSLEFDLTVDRIEGDRVAESEVFEALAVDPDHNRYAPRVVGSFDRSTGEGSRSGESELVRLSDLTLDDDGDPEADAAARRMSRPFHGVDSPMTGGTDDLANIDDSTFVGTDSEDPDGRTGIHSLRNEDSISIVAVPGRTSVTVQKALVAHCELMRYRFAVMETPVSSGLRDARGQRQNFDTTRAAMYYPWLVLADPFGQSGDLIKVPPSGHVMGIYARSDSERGVWKAPANEVVRGILQFETTLTKGEQDILNPLHVNCFRDFRTANRGLRLWGARTLSSDPEWKYVNVRRLFLFLEKSIENGLQFAVFESNTEALWATVKRSISNFLITVWRDGGLEGTTEEEAFFVNVGFGVTMTQADIDNGRLIVEVGVAPVKPAEFVIIRISQKTREATT